MITGMMPRDPRWDEEVRRLEENAAINAAINAAVKLYFEHLGYEVGWDFRHGVGSWHEISDSDGLICQIDRNVPLDHIIEDLTQMARGKSGTSKSDYTISTGGRENPRFDELCERVAKNQRGGIQETLPLEN